MNRARTQAGLRLIARGLEELAAGLDETAEVDEDERTARVIRGWGRRGLTRQQASDLFKAHGFAPQATGGWTRADWVKVEHDGLRYLTTKPHGWLSDRTDPVEATVQAVPTDD